MKKDQEDLRSSVDTAATKQDLETILAALKNLQHEEAEATCVTIPLPELLQGPKHVAELIMEEQKNKNAYSTTSKRHSSLSGCTYSRKLS